VIAGGSNGETDAARALNLHQLLHHPAQRLAQEIQALTLEQVADDDIRLLHDRDQCLLGTAARLQEAREIAAATRKVDQVVESLGLRISKSEVSRICAGLDEQVDAFRNRPLEGRYPYLWLDAKVEKVRDGGRVVRKCLVLAYGVHESGYREVIGLDVGEAETEAFWRSFLRSLVERGLSGVQLVVSDVKGVKTTFTHAAAL
jgi:hypothetical protein